jgi:hypothetical protein
MIYTLFAILAIIIGGILEYRSNRKIDSIWANLNEEESIEAKKKWAYFYWKTAKKHILIGCSIMILGGIIIESFERQYVHRVIVDYIGFTIMAIGAIYLIASLGMKVKKYISILEELNYHGYSYFKMIRIFKKWKKEGK